MDVQDTKFVYFGGEPLGLPVLEELKVAGYMPSVVVASPDRPSGRGKKLTPPPVKVWAEERNIKVVQPTSYKDKESQKLFQSIGIENDLFIVVAYNFILPAWLLELPKHRTLNVHPSLLPLLRGASPIRTAILHDMKDQIGVSVMVLDEKMDHGPIVSQARTAVADEAWPMRGPELDELLARQGGRLLAASLPGHLSGNLTPHEQEHDDATYCSRFAKSDGKLSLDPHHLPTGSEAYQTLLTIYAFMDSPGTYFEYNDKRIKINDATIKDGQLILTSVTPAGKKPQPLTAWLHSQSK